MTSNTADQAFEIPGVGDPRYNFAHVVSVAGVLIKESQPEHMSYPTPCAEFDVETLLAHMVGVLHRVAAVARDEDPLGVPHIIEKQEGASWFDAWMAAAHEVQAEWSDPAILNRMLTLPFGVMPGGAALTASCGEIAVHAWDLAEATNQSVTFEDELLAEALVGLKFGLPAEGRGPDMPFDPVIEVPANAPVVDQLAAWMGHRDL